MPVDYLQVRKRIQQMGRDAGQRQMELARVHTLAQDQLSALDHELDQLSALVDRGMDANPSLRCARPFLEPLTFHTSSAYTNSISSIVAADGSQITPSRHDPIPFALVNAGAIIIRSDRPGAPHEETRSALLVDDELFLSGRMLSEDAVALQRDLAERKLLVELAQKLPLPIVALTDGPLEIYGEPKAGVQFEQPFHEYLTLLHQLGSTGAVVAGYVDRPGADLVVRMLELAQEGGTKGQPFSGVNDRVLYSDLLAPGERSAIFALRSRSAKQFEDDLELHFFYLNIGRAGKPSLARIEIPRWVAVDKDSINLVHGVILDQCRQLGGRPYPYVLHRAHEIAVVHREEKDEIEIMLLNELSRQGFQPADLSNKQILKDISGKGR